VLLANDWENSSRSGPFENAAHPFGPIGYWRSDLERVMRDDTRGVIWTSKLVPRRQRTYTNRSEVGGRARRNFQSSRKALLKNREGQRDLRISHGKKDRIWEKGLADYGEERRLDNQGVRYG